MKTILITGAGRGIGHATAILFLEQGWHVLAATRSGNMPIKNPELEIYRLDLKDPDSIIRLAKTLRQLPARIDVLVNNAGINLDQDDGTSISRNVLIDTLDVNLIGLVDFTEKILPAIADGGQIINISSGAGSITETYGSYSPAYKISKAAVNMYTKVLANRLSSRKITVSSVDPGWVKTDMGGHNAPRYPTEAARDIFDLVISKVSSGNFWYQGRKKPW